MSVNTGQATPGWFKAFLYEYRSDRNDMREAVKSLSSSTHSLTEHINKNSAEIHEMRKGLDQTNRELALTIKELIRTRKQSANLFIRLIGEVKALRTRR